MTMGFLAGATKRIRFITSVMILPYRNPDRDRENAREPRRFVGRARDRRRRRRLDEGRIRKSPSAEPFEERGKVTDEYIRAFRELWTSDDPSFNGKYCNFSNHRLSAQAGAETGDPDLDRRP